MKTKIIFRADAGKSIGFGHFIRSLALASYLKDDFDCYFTTYNPDSDCPSSYQMEEIGKVCKFITVSGKDRNDFDSNFLKLLSGDEIIVLDNYYFTTYYQQKIKDKGCKLVCVDDMHDRTMVCDLLLTGSPLSRNDFDLPPSSIFIGGIQHSFLREPFLGKTIKRGNPTKIDKVVLAVGGADPYNLTNTIIEIILSLNPWVSLSVIAGDTVNIIPEFEDKIALYSRLSAEEIVNIFNNSDLGIFPASTICIEALACQLPIAAFWYVDNQDEFYHYGVRNDLFIPLGNPLQDIVDFKTNIYFALNKDLSPIPFIDFNKGKIDIIEAFKSL